MKISDISFGASRLRSDEDLVRHAFERGINYFDTAESYTGGRVRGRRIGQRARRASATASTLDDQDQRRHRRTRAEMMRALEGSLRRLQTDHIDVYFNHAVNDVARLKNPEWPEFVARGEAAGQDPLRGHVGARRASSSSASTTPSTTTLVDVVLVAYNFGQDPAFYQKLHRAASTSSRSSPICRACSRRRRQKASAWSR